MSTQVGSVVQNTERLEHCPDCHLAQFTLRKGAREHVLHCDGSLKKGLPFSNIEEESQKHEPYIYDYALLRHTAFHE
jgi:hypothetical protein